MVMSIKEPNFYREYSVIMAETQGNYIPCMPTVGSMNPITRISAGTKFKFVRKLEEDLYEIELFDNDKAKALITSYVFEWLLPVYRKKR
jgi:hypothetical protein